LPALLKPVRDRGTVALDRVELAVVAGDPDAPTVGDVLGFDCGVGARAEIGVYPNRGTHSCTAAGADCVPDLVTAQ
jgi:hypothetical protein